VFLVLKETVLIVLTLCEPAAAFFVPQMLTATLWGIASDKLGRKPIMLLGLLASAGCMVLFGFSGSLVWAILSRALCGFFNGDRSSEVSSNTPSLNKS